MKSEKNYIVAWCLKDEHFTDLYGHYTDFYERFTGENAYANAQEEYDRVLKEPNLYTASLSIELESTD
jgi:uncharacterized protein (DUF608 family)